MSFFVETESKNEEHPLAKILKNSWPVSSHIKSVPKSTKSTKTTKSTTCTTSTISKSRLLKLNNEAIYCASIKINVNQILLLLEEGANDLATIVSELVNSHNYDVLLSLSICLTDYERNSIQLDNTITKIFIDMCEKRQEHTSDFVDRVILHRINFYEIFNILCKYNKETLFDRIINRESIPTVVLKKSFAQSLSSGAFDIYFKILPMIDYQINMSEFHTLIERGDAYTIKSIKVNEDFLFNLFETYRLLKKPLIKSDFSYSLYSVYKNDRMEESKLKTYVNAIKRELIKEMKTLYFIREINMIIDEYI